MFPQQEVRTLFYILIPSQGIYPLELKSIYYGNTCICMCMFGVPYGHMIMGSSEMPIVKEQIKPL